MEFIMGHVKKGLAFLRGLAEEGVRRGLAEAGNL
jgi:hypothetical protein